MWRNVAAAATDHRVSVVQGASRGMIKRTSFTVYRIVC